MQKTALILHGWPQYDVSEHFLVRYLEREGYDVVAPNLFDPGFVFNLFTVRQLIRSKLGDENPILIVGISFGGLVLPHIAVDYPRAKLVFVSTGPNFNPKPRLFNLFLKIAEYKWANQFGAAVLKMPSFIFDLIYKIAYTTVSKGNDQLTYKEDMVRNLGFIKTISPQKNIELVKFAKGVNNTILLRRLNNASIIFSGENDKFMPLSGGKVLHKLLKNSELSISNGEHFNVFSEKDLKRLDKFLKD